MTRFLFGLVSGPNNTTDGDVQRPRAPRLGATMDHPDVGDAVRLLVPSPASIRLLFSVRQLFSMSPASFATPLSFTNNLISQAGQLEDQVLHYGTQRMSASASASVSQCAVLCGLTASLFAPSSDCFDP